MLLRGGLRVQQRGQFVGGQFVQHCHAVAESSSGSVSGGAATAAEGTKQAREACEKAVVGKAAGATFPEPGTLRAASSAEGKQYTVTGTAQVSGAATTYTCFVIVPAGQGGGRGSDRGLIQVR